MTMVELAHDGRTVVPPPTSVAMQKVVGSSPIIRSKNPCSEDAL
jgi:hypothetical protein